MLPIPRPSNVETAASAAPRRAYVKTAASAVPPEPALSEVEGAQPGGKSPMKVLTKAGELHRFQGRKFKRRKM